VTRDESHVSVGGMLGATQLGQILGKDSEFCGVRNTKDVLKYEVDHVAKQRRKTNTTQYRSFMGKPLTFFKII